MVRAFYVSGGFVIDNDKRGWAEQFLLTYPALLMGIATCRYMCEKGKHVPTTDKRINVKLYTFFLRVIRRRCIAKKKGT